MKHRNYIEHTIANLNLKLGLLDHENDCCLAPELVTLDVDQNLIVLLDPVFNMGILLL